MLLMYHVISCTFRFLLCRMCWWGKKNKKKCIRGHQGKGKRSRQKKSWGSLLSKPIGDLSWVQCLGRLSPSNLPRGHCPRQPKGIYAQQTSSLGILCQTKKTKFVIRREVPFTKKRKGGGSWRQKTRQSGRRPALFSLIPSTMC